MRAIFFEEDDARAAEARLLREGYRVAVERDRLAGEDDDEGHPWQLTSDAPELLLELLVDELDGWLDVPDTTPPAAAPLDLPAAPKRVKRPQGGGD